VTFAPVETKGTKAQSRSVDENLKLTETGNRQSLIEHKARGGQLEFKETAQNEIGKRDAESTLQSSNLCGYILPSAVVN
jgi:hypothetical protein